MSFWKNVSPRRAIRDLREQFIQPQPHRWRFLALSAAVTCSIFLLMFQQGDRGPPRPPQVTYFPSFLPGRTDAQIMAENRAATEEARRAEAEEEASAERVRKMYKTVGDATGVDTDKAYNEGTAEREAAKRRVQEQREAILKGRVAQP
jgi:hypothetical protein